MNGFNSEAKGNSEEVVCCFVSHIFSILCPAYNIVAGEEKEPGNKQLNLNHLKLEVGK